MSNRLAVHPPRVGAPQVRQHRRGAVGAELRRHCELRERPVGRAEARQVQPAVLVARPPLARPQLAPVVAMGVSDAFVSRSQARLATATSAEDVRRGAAGVQGGVCKAACG